MYLYICIYICIYIYMLWNPQVLRMQPSQVHADPGQINHVRCHQGIQAQEGHGAVGGRVSPCLAILLRRLVTRGSDPGDQGAQDHRCQQHQTAQAGPGPPPELATNWLHWSQPSTQLETIYRFTVKRWSWYTQHGPRIRSPNLWRASSWTVQQVPSRNSRSTMGPFWRTARKPFRNS